MVIRIATYVALGALAACGDTDSSPGTDAADTTVATDVAPDTLADVTSDAVPDVAPAPALPPLAQALEVTPGDGLGDVRVQPALAWGPADNGVGRLVVAWTGASGEDLGIFAGAWDVDGDGLREVTTPALVHVARDGLRNEPALCALAGGGFVVAWSADAPSRDGNNLHVAFRRLDAAGVPVGEGEVEHETDRPGNHWLAELACAPAGGFVLAGVRPGPREDMGFEAFVQRFDASGAPDGDVIAVFPRDEGGQAFPVVGVDAQGTLRVAWEDAPDIDGRNQIAMREFVTSSGTAVGGERIVVLASAGEDAIAPVIAVDPASGDTLVGGVLGSALQVALDTGAGPVAVVLPDAGGAITSSSAAAAIGDGAFELVWFRGSGATVDVRHARLEAGAFGDATTVVTGRFPLAYRPALAVVPDFGAIGFTESLGDGKFAVRVMLYRP